MSTDANNAPGAPGRITPEAAAQTLYGSNPSNESRNGLGAPGSMTHDAAAKSLYDATTPEDGRVQSSEDHALYGRNAQSGTEVLMRTTFRGIDADLANVIGLSKADRQQAYQYAAKVFHETGLDPVSVGDRVVRNFVSAQLAIARGRTGDADAAAETIGDTDVAVETRDNLVNLRTNLRSEFGGDDARVERILARSEAFLQQHPKLQELLSGRGLGADPVTVEKIVEHVRRLERL